VSREIDTLGNRWRLNSCGSKDLITRLFSRGEEALFKGSARVIPG
jgi:hypothetical protein